QKSDRVIVVFAKVVRRIGDLAHLQNYVFVEHPVEIAKEHTGRVPHEGLIFGRTGLKKLAGVKINRAREDAVIRENFDILCHFSRLLWPLFNSRETWP